MKKRLISKDNCEMFCYVIIVTRDVWPQNATTIPTPSFSGGVGNAACLWAF